MALPRVPFAYILTDQVSGEKFLRGLLATKKLLATLESGKLVCHAPAVRVSILAVIPLSAYLRRPFCRRTGWFDRRDACRLGWMLHGQERRVSGDSAYASQKALVASKAPRAEDLTGQRVNKGGVVNEVVKARAATSRAFGRGSRLYSACSSGFVAWPGSVAGTLPALIGGEVGDVAAPHLD